MTIYTARQLPADLPGGGWYALLPKPGPVVQLAGEVVADWVVIGAGFAGLTAAKRLSERCQGDKVVVLEAQRVGWGSAGRNSGFMIDLPHDISSDDYGGKVEEDLKQIRMNRAAINYAAGAVEEYGLQEHFAAVGKYHGAVNARGLERLKGFCRHLDGLGEAWRGLDRAQMAEVTGVDYYAGGMYAPGAAVLQPAGYIRGLAAGLRARVRIYEESAVVKLVVGGGEVVVHTAGGVVRAARVILAVNGHAQSLGFYRRRLMHVFAFASMTRRLSEAEQRRLGGMQEWGLIPADPLGATLRRYRDRLVVRNTFTYNPSLRTSRAQVARLGRRHARAFGRRFPMLGEVGMEYRWGGALCLSLNGVAAFGEVDEGVYAAVCCNGLGAARATYGGLAVADLATGQENRIVADMLSAPRPARLWPEPFMSVGAKAVLWWRQWRAAKEM